MSKRKTPVGKVPIIEFKTAPDRDTAALMIEAMVWWAENPEFWVCNEYGNFTKYTFYVRSAIEAYPRRDTPWDAILAAKKASEG